MAINAHTHLYSGLVPLGLPRPAPEPAGLEEILERVWWRLDRALDASALRAAAQYYLAHARLAGTTGLVDHHESPACIEGSLDLLAKACVALGMPALLCYGASERNGGRDEARRGLAECRRFITENAQPLLRGCVGLHASFTVSDETLREAGELARELDSVVHVHVAEDLCDLRDARDRGYEGPLERLLACDALPPGSILAHGVHLDAAQLRRAEDEGLWLVQNPRSNLASRVGWPVALGEIARVALGTDGYPSDMRVEASVLLAECEARGEDTKRAATRPALGAAVLRERFGTLPEPGPFPSEALVAEIEEAARAEATRLWQRMEAL